MDEELNMMGLVKLTTEASPPENYVFCNGQTLEIKSNAPLFSILGTSFGGDGLTTFQLPKLAPMDGAQYIICIKGMFPTRS